MKTILQLFVITFALFCNVLFAERVFHYYCTAADERHFQLLMQLIGSIHKHDFKHLDEIAVFDLGLTGEQKEKLATIEKTKVFTVELVHPDLLKYVETNAAGRCVRGSFAWKPVIFKQALDMYPYFLYLDSGTMLLNSPDQLFSHIQETGYYIMHIAPHNIEERITKPVIDKVLAQFSKEEQEFLLQKETPMIDAGFQGISRKIKDSYVLPMYRLAFDLTLFADDGTARLGYGAGRHDQTLFSIFANVQRLKMNCQGWTDILVDGKSVPFHIHWDRGEINDKTVVYRSRGDSFYGGDKTANIRFCKKWSILICTLEERKECFSHIYNKLLKQIQENHLEDQVEVVFFKDNRENSVGKKRNALIKQSHSKYISFIDDDDDVHDDYVKMIYGRLERNPDCVSLVGTITFNGQSPQTFIHSIEHTSYYQKEGVYFRPPNHLNPIRKSIAEKFCFPEISYGEDTDWAMQIARSGLLVKEEKVDVPYYFYKYVDK